MENLSDTLLNQLYKTNCPMREFGCGVTSRHARRRCRNRGGL